jgi:hypothetical protein
MSQEILHFQKLPHFDFGVRVPDDWDYWTIDGKRVNFKIKRISKPEYPDYTGVSIILWIFSIYFIWRKL